jgi:hypothetical protein
MAGLGMSNVTAMDPWLSLFSYFGFFAIEVARCETYSPDGSRGI